MLLNFYPPHQALTSGQSHLHHVVHRQQNHRKPSVSHHFDHCRRTQLRNHCRSAFQTECKFGLSTVQSQRCTAWTPILTVYPSVYNTLSATAFVPPVNPGPTAIITAGATAAVIANEYRSFNDTTTLFKKYDSSDKALKKCFSELLTKCLYPPYIPSI